MQGCVSVAFMHRWGWILITGKVGVKKRQSQIGSKPVLNFPYPYFVEHKSFKLQRFYDESDSLILHCNISFWNTF